MFRRTDRSIFNFGYRAIRRTESLKHTHAHTHRQTDRHARDRGNKYEFTTMSSRRWREICVRAKYYCAISVTIDNRSISLNISVCTLWLCRNQLIELYGNWPWGGEVPDSWLFLIVITMYIRTWSRWSCLTKKLSGGPCVLIHSHYDLGFATEIDTWPRVS